MAHSILLAQIIGIYLVSISAIMFIHKHHYQTTALQIMANSSVMFLVAIITLILGIVLVTSHNIWVWDWPVIITIIAWLTFIKGEFHLFFPGQIKQWSKILENNTSYYIALTVCFLVGLYLLIIGFYVY